MLRYLGSLCCKHGLPRYRKVRWIAHVHYSFTSVREASDLEELRSLCQENSLDDALELAQASERQGKRIPSNTIHGLLELCIDKKQNLPASKVAYSIALRHGLQPHLAFWADHLIRLSASCGHLPYSNWVFSTVAQPSLFTWNSIISVNSKHGDKPRALCLYQEMQQQLLIAPDKFTFLGSLKACSCAADLDEGRIMHADILSSGLEMDTEIGNALLDMYVKCGSLSEGQAVFKTLPHRNVVTWGTMISGYVQEGEGDAALGLYKTMQQDGVEPDIVLLSCVLKACITTADISQGRLVHIQIMKSSLEHDIIVGNTLINLYLRCGSLQEARSSFDEIPNRDLVSWNSMIAGYTFYGEDHLALWLYERMPSEVITPDKVTFSSILKSCGVLGAVRQGSLIHSEIVRLGVRVDVVLQISLIDMYAKCGKFDDAFQIVDKQSEQSVKTWNALIAGCADHGNLTFANQCLEAMRRHDLKPNCRTFSSILAACSHAGLVGEGRRHFNSMVQDHGISPDAAHFNCIIDLLGRAGQLHEAEQLQQTLPRSLNAQGWRSLLASCRTHGHSVLGRECYGQAIDMVPESASGYMLMSSISADAQDWENVFEIQELRKCASAVKKPGAACIEIDNKVYRFVVGERTHSQGLKAYPNLEGLKKVIKGIGYVPQVDSVVEFVRVNKEEEEIEA